MTRSRLASCPGLLAMPTSRRAMLQASANGFGMLALQSLFTSRTRAASPDENAKGSRSSIETAAPRPHFAPQVRNVIFCFMDGGVSHVDSFDPKPKLAEVDGQAFNGS